jgi:Tol biopolymer transport system component
MTFVAAPPGSEDYAPTWSRRGRLAFIRHRPAVGGSGFVHEILSVDRRGGTPRVLAQASRYSYRSLAWSHDGRRLAYTVPYDNPSGLFAVGLFVVRPGDEPRFLLRATGMGEIDWSPNDRAIVLAASVPDAEPFDPYRLFAITVSDRQITQLTTLISSRTGDAEPRWSPDGSVVVFTRTGPRRSSVMTVRPDGTRATVVAADARGASWSRDGRFLAYVEGVSGERRPLTLTVRNPRAGVVTTRVPLRFPLDAVSLSAQAWR